MVIVDDKDKLEKEKKKHEDDGVKVYDKETAAIIRVRCEMGRVGGVREKKREEKGKSE